MIVVAGAEASHRTSRYYNGMHWHAMLSVGAAVAMVLIYALTLVITTTTTTTTSSSSMMSFLRAQIVIPVTGMLLGNSITSYSLALDRLLVDTSSSSIPIIELKLCLGAQAQTESALSILQSASLASLTPIFNTMSVVGLVAIPGMMTGQILGGQAPGDAAKYQMIILYLISSSNAITMILGLGLAMRFVVFDLKHHQLRSERILQRAAAAAAAAGGAAAGGNKKRQKRADILVRTCHLLFRTVCHLCFFQNTTEDDTNQEDSSKKEPLDNERDFLIPKRPFPASIEMKTLKHPSQDYEEPPMFRVENLTVGIIPSHSLYNHSHPQTTTTTTTTTNNNQRITTIKKEEPLILLEHVSFVLYSGDIMVITGESGLGKSRLLRQLVMLDPPPIHPSSSSYNARSNNKLYLYDQLASSMSSNPLWRTFILYIPQDIPMLPDTPMILLQTCQNYHSRKQHQHHKHHKHHNQQRIINYDWITKLYLSPHHIHKSWSSLSGGERQRCILWVALNLYPKVLLLDEPTSHLDEITTLAVENVICERIMGGSNDDDNDDMAVIWVTHNLEQAARIGTQSMTLSSTTTATTNKQQC